MKKGICKHYSGNVFRRGECCKNINVRDLVGGGDAGWLVRTPCFKEHDSDISCVHFLDPTKKEINDEEKEWEKHLEKIMLAIPIISELKEKYAGTGGKEIVTCPVCQERLYCSVSSLNGHAHVKCETDDCLCWME